MLRGTCFKENDSRFLVVFAFASEKIPSTRQSQRHARLKKRVTAALTGRGWSSLWLGALLGKPTCPNIPADTPDADIGLRERALQQHLGLASWTLLLSAVAFGPIFIFPFPGLQDYPNHLARAFILLHRSDPVFERLYSVQWAIVPNLGWDLWAVGVGRLLSLELTGKLYLAFSSALILTGCFVLNRALLGKWTFAPLFATPFLFNSGFTKGFLSFNLGIGCALLAITCWISFDEKHWRWRLLVGTLFSSLLYVIHLYGWAFYGVFVLGRELQVIFQTKQRLSVWPGLLRLGRDGLQAIPALTMMAVTAYSAVPTLAVDEFRPPYIRIGEVAHLIDVGDDVANVFTVVIVGLLVVVMFWRGWLRFRSDFALPLIFCVVFFFILPDRIAGTYFVSWRILMAALLCGIASLSPSKEFDVRTNQIMSVVTLITAVIVGVHIWSWRNSDIGRKDFLALIRDVPQGSALFVVHDGMTSTQLTRYAVGLYHVGAFAVLTKRALVQSLFVFSGQQLLRYRDPVLQAVPGNSFTFLTDVMEQFKSAGLDFLPPYLQRFDYFVVHGPNSDEMRVLPTKNLTLVNQVNDFRLYRVNKPISSRGEISRTGADKRDD